MGADVSNCVTPIGAEVGLSVPLNRAIRVEGDRVVDGDVCSTVVGDGEAVVVVVACDKVVVELTSFCSRDGTLLPSETWITGMEKFKGVCLSASINRSWD